MTREPIACPIIPSHNALIVDDGVDGYDRFRCDCPACGRFVIDKGAAHALAGDHPCPEDGALLAEAIGRANARGDELLIQSPEHARGIFREMEDVLHCGRRA